MPEDHPTAHEASREAVHTAKNAAQALEAAREAQLAEAIQETAKQTEAAVLRALTSVFGDGDKGASGDMNILWRRIPFICNDIANIHKDLSITAERTETIKNDLKWMKWIGSGFVIGVGMIALKSFGV